jgi:hypothetical protein
MILHLRRDPRALIPSFRRAFDAEWWSSLVLEDLLLNVEDGRSSYFKSWGDDIRVLDRQGSVARLAGYWALTEKHVREHKPDSNHVTLNYEQLCLKGQSYLTEKLSERYEDSHPQWTLKQNSITTNTVRLNTDSVKRVDSWKEESDPATIRTVERVVNDLGMADLFPSYN